MTELALALVAAQIGVILGISLLAAPTVFAALPAESAGPYLRRLFPRYFATAAALAGLAAIVAAAGESLAVAGLLVIDSALFVGALALVPRINRARDTGDPRFRRLHGLSVAGNGAGLVVALTAALWLAI